MSKIHRRHFLQFSAATLASIVASQSQTARYSQVLAQRTSRKLALLTGINKYPKTGGYNNLYGCVTDVELQRYLLIHRFGFKESDILVLTDAEASRDNILQAFEDHLIGQAKSGDVVVFHFSGHGSRIIDRSPIDLDTPLNSTLVPADAATSREGKVNDIMGQTLFLLTYALQQKTENSTIVLDSCYSGGGTRGDTVIRAARAGRQVGDAEIAYQESLLSHLNLTPGKFQELRRQGPSSGVAIASAQHNQVAADYNFGDFHAGAFTFLLTQSLWQQGMKVNEAMDVVTHRLKALSSQIPFYEVKANSRNASQPIYLLNRGGATADAVVLDARGDRATLWLGGLSRKSLDAFGEGAIFISSERGEATQVEIVDRDGLQGKATVKGALKPGDLLQEYARAIPEDWKLSIGLDPSLGRLAKTAAHALNQPRMEAIASQNAGKPYAKNVHYILSYLTEDYRNTLQAEGTNNLPPLGSLGLFSPALEPIPDSFGTAGESIENAIARLRNKLRGLLAVRIVGMTLNAQSSRLNVGVRMILERSQTQLIAQAFTFRGECEASSECIGRSRGEGETEAIAKMPLGETFRLELQNGEPEPLYIGVLTVDRAGKVTVLFPNNFLDETEEERDRATRIEPRAILKIPDRHRGDGFELFSEKLGAGEVFVIASKQPMTEAFLRLQRLAGDSRDPQTLEEPIAVIEDFVSGVGRTIGVRRRISTVDMAALSISYEVV
ncbi:MAG: caspase family protein [Cyanobacteria bacterium SBLK]|nr:caspase family protein [Cyanobacteria bacterium SBLK]